MLFSVFITIIISLQLMKQKKYITKFNETDSIRPLVNAWILTGILKIYFKILGHNKKLERRENLKNIEV